MQREDDKELVWLSGEVKTPPFSQKARIEAGYSLRRLQQGDLIGLPLSRPMPTIGKHCHELRIVDENVTWRIIYRIDSDAIIILEVFRKKKGKLRKILLKFAKRGSNNMIRSEDYDG